MLRPGLATSNLELEPGARSEVIIVEVVVAESGEREGGGSSRPHLPRPGPVTRGAPPVFIGWGQAGPRLLLLLLCG
jgi:hypothetical protein